MHIIDSVNEYNCIGRPLPHVKAFVDKKFQQKNLGELIIEGEAVAQGYTPPHRQDKAFSYKHGRRIYRTGDLVRIDGDGLAFYEGRIDRIVKIRGQNIDLRWLEERFMSWPVVDQVLLLCVHHKLFMFYEGRAPEELKPWLATLSSLEHPFSVRRFEHLPLAFNGKIDRQALMRLAQSSDARNEQHLTKTYADVANKIWNKVFSGQGNEHQEDNFFENGGDSLTLVELSFLSSSQKIQGGNLFNAHSMSKLILNDVALRFQRSKGSKLSCIVIL